MTDEIINIETRDDTIVVTLNFAEITHEVSEELQQMVAAASAGRVGMSLALDLTALTFLGSVGLTTLVILLKRLRESGGRMVVVGLAGQRMRVMVLTRMTRIFELQPDMPHALAALEKAEEQ